MTLEGPGNQSGKPDYLNEARVSSSNLPEKTKKAILSTLQLLLKQSSKDPEVFLQAVEAFFKVFSGLRRAGLTVTTKELPTTLERELKDFQSFLEAQTTKNPPPGKKRP